MGIDYGGRLQNYAYEVISDDVAGELQSHLNEWKVYSNNLVLYAHRGLANFQTNLEEAKKAMEAQRQRNGQLAMFVLSLLSGPAMSFVAGALEHRLAPKLFGSQTSKIRTIPNPKYVPPPPPPPPAPPPVTLPKAGRVISPNIPRGPASPPPKVKLPHAGRTINPVGQNPPKPTTPPSTHIDVRVHDPNFSQTKGKILGDTGASLMGAFLVNPAIKALSPDRTPLTNAINKVPDALDLDELDKNLDNAWLQAQTFGKKAIQFFANTIREDNAWGDRLWAKLTQGTLAGVAWAADESSRYSLGKEWIHSIVNQQRESWARQEAWFYYGNLPAPVSEPHVINAVATELWALWIAQENFQPQTHYDYGPMDREGNSVETSRTSYEEPIGNSRVELNRILPYLRRLGVLEGRADLEYIKRNIHKEPGLMPIEIDDIYGTADTQRELDSVKQWAANRKPAFFGGKLGSVPRSMGKLVVTGKY